MHQLINRAEADQKARFQQFIADNRDADDKGMSVELARLARGWMRIKVSGGQRQVFIQLILI
ncbi:hypothetical protein D3C77_782830 [compost metagenome]